MKKICFIYPNKYFLDFIKAYLYQYNYYVDISHDGISGYNQAVQGVPDLLIINKELPSIDLDGFFIKKKVTPAIKNIPLFLIGDFNPAEVVHYKNCLVESFLSYPINPQALVERLNSYFKYGSVNDHKKTPMLYDMHAKGNILVIQIEGNFEPGKLEILNYRMRMFFNQKKISKPKIFFIFPSLYPETITNENLEILFGITRYKEFKVLDSNIKILTNNKVLTNLLKNNELYSKFDRVSDYYDGMQLLNTDFDKHKTIPVEFLKVGTGYIFDLYDDEGDVRIPALSKVTEDMKTYFLNSGVKNLTYYSNTELTEASNNGDENKTDYSTLKQFDLIMSSAENVSPETDDLSIVNEKIHLFLNKLKGFCILVVSNSVHDKEMIKKTLEDYMTVDFINQDENVIKKLDEKKYILSFLDHTLENPKATEILSQIRSVASRRKISVIIVAKSMNKLELNKYKTFGTDYVLLSPFSESKLQHRIFNSIIMDRKT
jgi:DNA-binding response OmpR family regulator